MQNTSWDPAIGGISEDRLESYLELAGDWLFELDAAANIVFCHKSATATYPYQPEELIGNHFGIMMPRNIQDDILQLLYACRDKKRGRVRTSCIDDHGYHIEFESSARYDSQGQFTGCCVLVRNLSKRLRNRWAQADSSRVEIKGLHASVEADDQNLRFQLQYQELLTSLWRMFSDDRKVVQMLDLALQHLGETLLVDRLCLFCGDSAHMAWSAASEWCAEGIPSAKEQFADAPYNNKNMSYRQLLSLPFVSVNDISKLPDGEYESLRRLGVKSFVNVPMWVEGEFWGFLGVHQIRGNRAWKIGELNLLQNAASIFSAALEKQKMQSTIRETFDKLDAIVMNFPGMIWHMDTQYRLTLCEGSGLGELGLSSEALVGRTIQSLADPNTPFIVFAERTYRDGPQAYTMEISGHYLTCNTNLLKDRDGNVIGQVGTAQDITAICDMQRKLEAAIEEAEQASQAKTDFLSRMSHEIRTPMNAIIGMSSIATKTDDRERIHYCLEKIGVASNQLLGLINDILDMSKIESGKFEIVENEFDFEAMLKNVRGVVDTRLEEKSQRLIVDFDDVFLSYIICDELRLSQVIINLLTNAIKFSPEKSEITLRIRHFPVDEELSKLHVEVIDQGIGISKEEQDRLFQSFEQADGSITRRFGGTGLGLAICKRIVNLMGGEIWVESEPGKGSNFTFEVEMLWGSDLMRDVTGGINSESIRILTVDDHEDVRLYFQNILQGFSLRNDVASGGKEALHLVRRAVSEGDPYSIVFMDWNMPGMDGIEAARRIKQISGDGTAIVIISVADWADIEPEAAKHGITEFLSKPVKPSMLFNTIRETNRLSLISTGQNGQEDTEFAWPDKKLLLAEDIEINKEIIMALLEDLVAEIHWVDNGQKAVNRFLEDPSHYDMILMDIQMPEVDGLQATRIIRASDTVQGKTIPIIAMTANAFKEDVARSLEAGMDDHIAKPIDLNELMAKLNLYLL